jgi:hypothetical protein
MAWHEQQGNFLVAQTVEQQQQRKEQVSLGFLG